MKTTIKFATLTLSIFYFIMPNQTKAQCHMDDWTALKALYESTNGDFWTNRNGWGTILGNNPPANCDLENLFGVYLDTNGRVTCLDLDDEEYDVCTYSGNGADGNNLSGHIPTEIEKLVELKKLSLTNNYLDGSIPPEIGNLTKLTHIYLNDNQFESIPPEIDNLTNLITIRLDNNQFSGLIPPEIGNLTSLEELVLSTNQFENIPRWIDNLTNLKILWLSGNQLNGNIPPELGNLNNLRSLRLNNNQLSGSIPAELGNLSNLSSLNLNNNELSGSIPPELCDLANLTRLVIDDNNLSGCYPDCINAFCTQLTNPNFDGNSDISDGNNFDATWEDFCATSAGACCTSNEEDCLSTNVYPGDLNHDGIVDNIDFVLKDAYLYNSGFARATEHQNTNWYAHPSEDWDIETLDHTDLKHHDCNGDGIIDEIDYEAVDDNWEMEWANEPVDDDTPEESDYQVRFYPIDELTPNYLRMNVALENITGDDLALDRAYFTIQYEDLADNVNSAIFNFHTFSWVGVPVIDFESSIEHYPLNKEIKVGYVRTDGENSIGNGIIGELTLELSETNNARTNANPCIINFEAVNMGTINNSSNRTLLQNQQLQVNLCGSTCQTNLYIDETQFQNEFKSTNLIETDGYLIIGEDQEVEYQSNRVCLRPGFKVKAGASFRAGYGSCN